MQLHKVMHSESVPQKGSGLKYFTSKEHVFAHSSSSYIKQVKHIPH